jgi:hypothetical protein
MRAKLALAAVLLAAVLAPGCFEGKGDFTFNPDGSGKVVIDLTFPAAPPWTGTAAPAPAVTATSATKSGAAKSGPKSASPFPTVATATPTAAGTLITAKTPEDGMKEVVLRLLNQTKGIDAWKDVSFELLGTSIHFKGTAYFKDLSKVQMYPDKTKTRIGFAPQDDGSLLLVLNKPDGTEDDLPPRVSLDPADLAKKMKSEREAYRKAKGDLSLDMLSMKLDLLFHVPGVPAPVKGLVEEDGALVMHVDGTRLLQSLDGPMADNLWLRKRILANETLGTQADAALKTYLNKQALAYKGESWARMTGDFRKRFDYAAEVETAKAAYSDMLVKLGLEKAKPAVKGSSTTGTATSTSRPAAGGTSSTIFPAPTRSSGDATGTGRTGPSLPPTTSPSMPSFLP